MLFSKRACELRLATPTAAILLSLLGGPSGNLAAAESSSERSNILFLLSDDHSYPFVSAYGDQNVKTPNLDRIAEDGVKARRFFTASPQCVPSRSSLLTGASPVANRMTRFTAPLPKDRLTFPEILKEQGNYYIGVCGRSYHLDGSGTQNNPVLDRVMNDHGLRTFRDRVDFLQNGPDKDVAKFVAQFLDARPSDKPFFLWANFSDPHHVWNAPESYRPDPNSLQLPPHLPDLPGVRQQFADYCAEVNRLDENVGGVLKVLAERGLETNTIILFAGDNGAALPHGKGSLYDPGSNVPLLIKGPGIRKGLDVSVLMSGEDIAPTLLDAVGIRPHEQMTGRSFWPLLIGEKFLPNRYIFVERGPHGSAPVSVDMSSSGYDLSRSVRSDRYKLIYNCTPWIPYSPVDSAGGAAWSEIKKAQEDSTLPASLASTYFTQPRPVYELYDLEQDPAELVNLAGRKEVATIEDELRAALIEKMVVDFDYLPLPAPYSITSVSNDRRNQQDSRAGQRGNRQQAFRRLDKNGDGQLSWDEFKSDREPSEAKVWFDRRDTDKNGYVDEEEYLPALPISP